MPNRKITNGTGAFCQRFVRVSASIILGGWTAGATQYVVPGGAGDRSGSSWANARVDVQAAVDAAALPGEEVWVAAGRYELTEPVALRSGSVMLGGFARTESAASQRNWDANVTLLNGQDTTRVVSMESISSGRTAELVVTCGDVAATNGMAASTSARMKPSRRRAPRL